MTTTTGPDKNQCLILLGHNGAGKSTLIRWLLGFYTHSQQHPFLSAWENIRPLDRTSVGFVPELPFLDQQLTVYDQFRLFSRLKKVSLNQADMLSLMSRTGLTQENLHRPIKQFSKGMKQRLMLSLALIGQPHTLLLDEPLSGLDPFGHQQIMSLIAELKTQCRLIFSTHSLEDAWHLGDEIWLLRDGVFAYQGVKPDTQNALNTLYFNHPPKHSVA